jgi:hypothetical protein
MPHDVWNRRFAVVVTLLVAILAAPGCGGGQDRIGGTRIPDNSTNRNILDVLETYRQAVERKDHEQLILLASRKYWEDSGTPSGSDDYGITGLADVLKGRFQKADEIRYSMRYVTIRRACPGGGSDVVAGCRAHVEVLIDASYTIADARGAPRRPDKRDQNELVLEWTCEQGGAGCKWLFVSGM